MVTMITEHLQSSSDDIPVVDCDVHVRPRSEAELVDYLPERFQSKGVAYPRGNWPAPAHDRRDGTANAERSVPSDPTAMAEAYLDPSGIEHAVITGGDLNLRLTSQPDRRYAAALTSAYNDWLVEEWLAADDRYKGSLSIASIAPERAAEEIRRLGDHPDVVQVILGGATRAPLGNERYWPIYEAASEMGLPVAIHAGTEGHGIAHPNTGAGYPSTYLEAHSVRPANFMGQLLNMVLEGVFVEYPDLEVVMVGGGYSWVPPFLWRMDKMWKGVNEDFPWVERRPSEYVFDHVYFATYPIDEPPTVAHQETMLDMVRAEETLLFGSNFPRWDSYGPGDDLPDLSPELERAIFGETATRLYGL